MTRKKYSKKNTEYFLREIKTSTTKYILCVK